MEDPVVLLSALLALLAGLAIGKAWERYKLQDGRWVDRRRARDSPHYMLGLNFLVANQIDPAIEELVKAAHGAGDPLEIHLILGNLYREKGQVGRAIQEHQALLQRPDLRKLEHANVLLCLGLDYKRGGFVDRALEAFTRGAAAGSRQPVRTLESREAVRRAAPVGGRLRDTAEARRAATEHDCRRQASRDSRLSRERARPGGAEADGLCGGGAAVRRGRSTLDPRMHRRISISAMSATAKATSQVRSRTGSV